MTAEAMTAGPATAPAAARATGAPRADSSMYELFTGLMTIISLGVMVVMLLVKRPEVDAVLVAVDTLFCLIFLFDFARSLIRAESKSAYLFGPRPGRTLPRGVLDLLGSIPAAGIFRFFRVFRLTRVVRIIRLQGPKALIADFLHRRAEAAVYVIIVATMLVLLFGASAIAFVEPSAEGSNIKTGGDAIWWAFVTITTVGYGDRFPVTTGGRAIGVLTMATGIAIFGVLTSYLATLFLGSTAEEEAEKEQAAAEAAVSEAAADATVLAELAAVRTELAELRRLLGAREPGAPG